VHLLVWINKSVKFVTPKQ